MNTVDMHVSASWPVGQNAKHSEACVFLSTHFCLSLSLIHCFIVKELTTRNRLRMGHQDLCDP